jgi:CheY-like chemotaxis protein
MPRTKILIIDDDKEFVEELDELLTGAGYDTVAISDSRVAVERASSVRPDVILLDLRMPGKSGVQVARELERTAATAHISIIAMTGYLADEESTALSEVSGTRACLQKPFQPLDVIAEIEKQVA